jgi:hypothetical protein
MGRRLTYVVIVVAAIAALAGARVEQAVLLLEAHDA